MRPRADDIEYQIDHWGDRFVIVTNDDAVDFRVMEAPLDDPGALDGTGRARARPPHQRGSNRSRDFLAVHEWDRAQPMIRIVDRAGKDHSLAIDPAPHDIGFGPNEQWDTPVDPAHPPVAHDAGPRASTST